MKDGKKLKLGNSHVTPRYIQEVQASKLGDAHATQNIFNKYKCRSLGMPKASPSSSTKHQVISPGAIFLSLHILCVVLGASVAFVFSVVQFACCSTWLDARNTCFGERHAPLSCLEHCSFHPLCSASVHFCQYYVQLWFSTHMLFRASQFSTLIYLVVRLLLVRFLVSLRKFLIETCFK